MLRRLPTDATRTFTSTVPLSNFHLTCGECEHRARHVSNRSRVHNATGVITGAFVITETTQRARTLQHRCEPLPHQGDRAIHFIRWRPVWQTQRADKAVRAVSKVIAAARVEPRVIGRLRTSRVKARALETKTQRLSVPGRAAIRTRIPRRRAPETARHKAIRGLGVRDRVVGSRAVR